MARVRFSGPCPGARTSAAAVDCRWQKHVFARDYAQGRVLLLELRTRAGPVSAGHCSPFRRRPADPFVDDSVIGIRQCHTKNWRALRGRPVWGIGQLDGCRHVPDPVGRQEWKSPLFVLAQRLHGEILSEANIGSHGVILEPSTLQEAMVYPQAAVSHLKGAPS